MKFMITDIIIPFLVIFIQIIYIHADPLKVQFEPILDIQGDVQVDDIQFKPEMKININGQNGQLEIPAGTVGPSRPAGLVGPPGPAGPVGPSGPAGPVGPQGLEGPSGPAGPAGLPGPGGPSGSEGPSGPAGPAGPQGLEGPSGPAGSAGPQGSKGPSGPAGPAGPQGSEGPSGPAGSAGPQGSDGPSGPAGSVGPQGSEGPSGPAGPAGPQGPAGPAGPSGCPVGFINLGTNECFKYVDDVQRDWTSANSKCASLGLYLAEPSDEVVVQLYKYMIENHASSNYVWLGGAADGSKWIWQRSQTQLAADNPAWSSPGHSSYTSSDRCLGFSLYQSNWNYKPESPYFAVGCTSSRTTLCQNP